MVDLPTPKRSHATSEDSQQPPQKRPRPSSSSYQASSQPIGNLLFSTSSAATNARSPGLGSLSVLPDELISTIFSELKAADYLRCQSVSSAFYAWCGIEGHWKLEYIKRSRGVLQGWRGSWRASYLHAYVKPTDEIQEELPSERVMKRRALPRVYSDVLYLPTLAAKFDANPLTMSHSFMHNIPKLDGRDLPILGDKPYILKHLMDDWAALSPSSSASEEWSLESLAQRFPETSFRAEAVLTKMKDYISYHDDCSGDESPLYIFDADFVEKTESSKTAGGRPGLGADFSVPAQFQDDLFKVLGAERPNHRWLIAGPARSGSTFHLDPNNTSAWNAVVTGRKLWICFPPEVVPPGIIVSEDWAEVEAPLSLAEWMMNYYDLSKKMYGPKAKDLNNRGKMMEGICERGEIFYVPSGWWHLVINLESSIAVTQNFVSSSNLPGVLHFLKHRAEQVSGFKLCSTTTSPCLSVPQKPVAAMDTAEYRGEDEDETGGSAGEVYDQFVTALEREFPDILKAGLDGLRVLEEEKSKKKEERRKNKEVSLWETVKGKYQEQGESTGFSFEFDVGMDYDEEIM